VANSLQTGNMKTKLLMEYKNAISLNVLKLRIVAVIEIITPQTLQNAWRKIEYCLDILRATKGAQVELI
jgi:hypothetical protein